MQSSPLSDCPAVKKVLEQARDTGERIGVHLPCMLTLIASSRFQLGWSAEGERLWELEEVTDMWQEF